MQEQSGDTVSKTIKEKQAIRRPRTPRERWQSKIRFPKLLGIEYPRTGNTFSESSPQNPGTICQENNLLK